MMKLLVIVAFFISSCISTKTIPEGKCEICKTAKADRETFCWIVWISDAERLVNSNSEKKTEFYWFPK